jgi:hypothetical protein
MSFGSNENAGWIEAENWKTSCHNAERANRDLVKYVEGLKEEIRLLKLNVRSLLENIALRGPDYPAQES